MALLPLSCEPPSLDQDGPQSLRLEPTSEAQLAFSSDQFRDKTESSPRTSQRATQICLRFDPPAPFPFHYSLATVGTTLEMI